MHTKKLDLESIILERELLIKKINAGNGEQQTALVSLDKQIIERQLYILMKISRFDEFQNDMIMDFNEKITTYYKSFKPKSNPELELNNLRKNALEMANDYIKKRDSSFFQ